MLEFDDLLKLVVDLKHETVFEVGGGCHWLKLPLYKY